MNADDDGFVEHFPIMRMVEAKPDDLKLLQYRGFAHVFDDKVLIIADWKENNYIQKDRYTPSKYLGIYEDELKKLAQNKDNSDIPINSIHSVYKMDTQVRLELGKVTLGAEAPEEIESHKEPTDGEGTLLQKRAPKQPRVDKDILALFTMFRTINPAWQLWQKNTTQRAAAKLLLEKYGLERTKAFLIASQKVKDDPFAPQVRSPNELLNKLVQLKTHEERRN